jgi:uncharacterized protein (TIGR02266 family)
MRIKLKYPDVNTFIQKYAVNISRGGIFISTKQPKPVGTYLKFEFVLAATEAISIIRGEGQVQWTKEFDPAQPNKAHGMGVKFTRLDAESQQVIDRALKWRADQAASREIPLTAPSDSSAPRIVTGDQSGPTVVAPPAAEPLAESERGINDPTRPVNMEEIGANSPFLGRPLDQHTRPIPVRDPTSAEIRLAVQQQRELDGPLTEWGVTEEQVARVLKRARPRMSAETTAELERLLLKPKMPTPSRDEAVRALGHLLGRGPKSR